MSCCIFYHNVLNINTKNILIYEVYVTVNLNPKKTPIQPTLTQTTVVSKPPIMTIDFNLFPSSASRYWLSVTDDYFSTVIFFWCSLQ